MPTSNYSAFHPCLERVSATSRTAVYGPVRTVVWEGRSRKAPPIPILDPELTRRPLLAFTRSSPSEVRLLSARNVDLFGLVVSTAVFSTDNFRKLVGPR